MPMDRSETSTGAEWDVTNTEFICRDIGYGVKSRNGICIHVDNRESAT